MIESEKIFFDTSPFIYFIENYLKYSDRVAEYIAVNTESIFVTSVITIMEFGVKPLKENNPQIIEKFKLLLTELDCKAFPIDSAIAERAAILRAKYNFLKPLDTLQLSTAIHLSCTKFFCNDKELKNVKEIDVVLVDDLINFK